MNAKAAPPTDTGERATGLPGQTLNLSLATLAFALTFWAWNLIGPLAVRYTAEMQLSSTQKALLVATPVLVGSVGRIPVGALTDRFGGRLMFPVLTLVSVPFVLLVAFAGNARSFPMLIVFGFFLGIAGTTFAVGIPFVNAWYQADRRGFATGIFGAGMGGTALSSFLTPRFVTWFGYTATHVIVAVVLVATAALCWFVMRNSPRWTPNVDPVVPKMTAALRLPVTWRMSFLYAVTFGGFVAFSTYLPTYLKDVYSFDLTAAGTRTAGFAIAAVLARRRPGPEPVLPAPGPARTLSEAEAYGVLHELGVPHAPVALRCFGEAPAPLPFAYPVVAKVCSAEIPHKTEVGGVLLNIGSDEELAAALATLRRNLDERAPKAACDEVLVQPMQKGLSEVLVGYRVDPDAGPIVMLAAGGIWAEVAKDRSIRLAPVTVETAREMVAEVNALKPLTGLRGKARGDLEALARTVSALSQLALKPELGIAEAEVNPLLVLPEGQGVVAVDALVFQRTPA